MKAALAKAHQNAHQNKNQILLDLLTIEQLLDENYPFFSTLPTYPHIYISLHVYRRLRKSYKKQEQTTDFLVFAKRNIHKNHTKHTIQLLYLDLVRSKFQKLKSCRAHCILRGLARLQAQAEQDKEYLSLLEEKGIHIQLANVNANVQVREEPKPFLWALDDTCDGYNLACQAFSELEFLEHKNQKFKQQKLF